MSPTRPPSVRKRQSLLILDLQGQLTNISQEKSELEQEAERIKQQLDAEREEKHKQVSELKEEIQTKDGVLRQKDQEIVQLRNKTKWFESEIARVNKLYETLASSKTKVSTENLRQLNQLQAKYERKREQLLKLSKENNELQRQLSELQTNMENVVQDEVYNTLKQKNAEVDKLRNELEKARQTIKQLHAKRGSDPSSTLGAYIVDTKEESYFASSCYDLFDAIQHWCNKFSRLSDQDCLSFSKMKDEAIRDRVETITLDDSGVRRLLKDKSRRKDVLMAIVTRIIWERIFTKYLFGMELDERQKLKALEKTLLETGKSIIGWFSIPSALTLSRAHCSGKPLARYNVDPSFPSPTVNYCA